MLVVVVKKVVVGKVVVGKVVVGKVVVGKVVVGKVVVGKVVVDKKVVFLQTSSLPSSQSLTPLHNLFILMHLSWLGHLLWSLAQRWADVTLAVRGTDVLSASAVKLSACVFRNGVCPYLSFYSKRW